jgi:hypothetical protein
MFSAKQDRDKARTFQKHILIKQTKSEMLDPTNEKSTMIFLSLDFVEKAENVK